MFAGYSEENFIVTWRRRFDAGTKEFRMSVGIARTKEYLEGTTPPDWFLSAEPEVPPPVKSSWERLTDDEGGAL